MYKNGDPYRKSDFLKLFVVSIYTIVEFKIAENSCRSEILISVQKELSKLRIGVFLRC